MVYLILSIRDSIAQPVFDNGASRALLRCMLTVHTLFVSVLWEVFQGAWVLGFFIDFSKEMDIIECINDKWKLILWLERLKTLDGAQSLFCFLLLPLTCIKYIIGVSILQAVIMHKLYFEYRCFYCVLCIIANRFIVTPMIKYRYSYFAM